MLIDKTVTEKAAFEFLWAMCIVAEVKFVTKITNVIKINVIFITELGNISEQDVYHGAVAVHLVFSGTAQHKW